MTDSIRIKIYPFQTTQDNPFFTEKKGSVDSDKNGQQRVKKYTQTNNKWRSEMQAQGKYVPLYQTETNSFEKGKKYLALEFSTPKFLQGLSLTEISEKDLDKLVNAVMEFCKTIKVSVSKHDILNAAVTRIDYCKNIQVSKFGIAQDIMKILSGFTYRFRSKFEPKYNTKGELTHIEYYNPTSHFVAYDKLLEILEHAGTTVEQALVQLIKNPTTPSGLRNIITDTIRFELSLHNTTAVTQAMQKFYDKKPFYTLQDVFKNDIAQVLLTAEVNDVYNHPLKAVAANFKHDFRNLNKKVTAFIDSKYTDGKLKSALEQSVIVLHSDGWAAVRAYLQKGCSPRTFARRIADLKEIEKLGISLDTPNEKVLEYILSQFGINSSKIHTPSQQSLF
jgi:hypothetical protein